MMEGRSNEQCRDRWNERLDPKINREAWTDEEDKLLVDAVGELGEGKWKAVSEKVGNRRKDSAVSDTLSTSPYQTMTRAIQCRARYEVIKRGKVKETTDLDGGSPPRPADGEGDQPDNASATTRPIPRKRASAKGKGKQPATPLLEDDSAQVGDNAVQLPQKRPRGRPRKVTQGREGTLETPGDGGSSAERVQRPVPRKRGRPPKAKSHDPTMEGPELEAGQNA